MTGIDEAQGHQDAMDVIVPASLAGERVDRVVAMLAGVTRNRAAQLVAQGSVVVDGEPARGRSRALVAGQRLQVALAPPEAPVLVPDDSVRFDVVYEDPHLIVVDKPPGLVVHHGAGNLSGTLVEGLVARFPDLLELAASGAGDPTRDPTRPGIVHRLDKGTSGLMVVARTEEAYRFLARQFREHTAARTYKAVVAGIVAEDAGVVDAPIGRSVRRPTRMAVRTGGRPARTTFRVVSRHHDPVDASVLDVNLETGRTHQVRVHLAAIGHPVFGDERYGSIEARPSAVVSLVGPGRVLLHAGQLTLVHPEGDTRTWVAPVPADLAGVLEVFER